MDHEIAQSTFPELLGLLLMKWWWMLHQEEEEELSITKAFGCPCANIDVLLVNARISKETTQGFTIRYCPVCSH